MASVLQKMRNKFRGIGANYSTMFKEKPHNYNSLLLYYNWSLASYKVSWSFYAELVFCCRAEAGLESLWPISIPLQSTGKYGETCILKPWINFCFIDSRQSFSKEAEDIPNLDFTELLSRGLPSKIFIFPSLMFLPDLLHVAIFSYTAIYLLSRRPSNTVILRSISWLTMLSTWLFSSEVIVSAFISKRQ